MVGSRRCSWGGERQSPRGPSSADPCAPCSPLVKPLHRQTPVLQTQHGAVVKRSGGLLGSTAIDDADWRRELAHGHCRESVRSYFPGQFGKRLSGRDHLPVACRYPETGILPQPLHWKMPKPLTGLVETSQSRPLFGRQSRSVNRSGALFHELELLDSGQRGPLWRRTAVVPHKAILAVRCSTGQAQEWLCTASGCEIVYHSRSLDHSGVSSLMM